MAAAERPAGDLHVGDLVEIHGLQGAKELNGQWGRVAVLAGDTGRIGVRLDRGRDATKKSVRPGNLRRVTLGPPVVGPMPEAFMRTTPGTPVFKLLLRQLPDDALRALARCQPGLRDEVRGADETWEQLLPECFGGDLATARRRCPGCSSPCAVFARLAAARRALEAVEVLRCDLGEVSRLGVEAAVVPANVMLEPYGMAARAVFAHAGPELLAHVQQLERPVDVGTAVWTPAFGLGLEGLVHAVGPNMRTADGDRRLHEVYAAAFAQVLEHGHRSVAFGSISTGGNGFEPELAAQVAVEEIRAVLARLGPGRPLRVVVATLETEVQDAFRCALGRIRERANEDLLEVLPIVIMDSMLPRQRLTFTCDNLPSGLHPGLERFGMVGVQRSPHGPVPLAHGVEVRVRGRLPAAAGEGAEQLEVVAGRLFHMPGALQREDCAPDARGRVHLQASVHWEPASPDVCGPGDLALSRSLEPLVDKWLALVRSGRERLPGQMDMVLEDLGPMPPAARLTDRALWVCALVNPLPGLGVAYEIRPAALGTTCPTKRLEVAKQGLIDSIANLDGTRPLGS